MILEATRSLGKEPTTRRNARPLPSSARRDKSLHRHAVSLCRALAGLRCGSICVSKERSGSRAERRAVKAKGTTVEMGIFWVASYPKSGNTWMRAFLANVLSPTRPVDLDSIAAFCTSESSAHWAWPFVDIKQVEVLPNREGMELRQKIQQRIVDLNEHQHVFIKTHNRYGIPNSRGPV